MKFTFACKKVALNDSIKEYAEKKISKLDRYFPEEADAFVTFAVEKKNRCVVELTIRAANGTLFRAQEEDPDGDMRGAIDEAVAEANAQGIHGKETTPFLLAKIKDLTGGDSLASNIQLVYNNARLAAQTAGELSRLVRG